MLQCGQDSTLNHALHRFVAHITRNYRHIASLAHFHLTTISQCDHHARVLNDGRMVFLDQLRGNKTVACTTIHQSYDIMDRLTSPLNNRVVSFGLPLMGAVQELSKNCNFFRVQAQFWCLQQQARITT